MTRLRRVLSRVFPIQGLLRARQQRKPRPGKLSSGDCEGPTPRARHLVVDGTHGAAETDNEDVDSETRNLIPPKALQRTGRSRVLSQTIAAEGDADEGDDAQLLKFYNSTVEKLKIQAGDKDHANIQGDLYSYLCIRAFGERSGLMQQKASAVQLIGLVIIIFVQILGPMGVFHWAVGKVDGWWVPHNVSEVADYDPSKNWGYAEDTDVYNFYEKATRLLGTVFIMLFCLNGSYEMQSQVERMRKTIDMVEVFRVVAKRTNDDNDKSTDYPEPCALWLWIGAIVNSVCVLCCCCCLVPLFIVAEDGPKDVIFDGLALIFMFNLDDVDGGFGFLDEQWDEDLFGDVYGMLADLDSRDDNTNLIQDIREFRDAHVTPDNLLFVAEYVLVALTLALPCLYAFANLRPKEELSVGNVAAVVDILRANMTALHAQLELAATALAQL